MPFKTSENKFALTKKLIPNLVHSIRNPLSVLKLNHYYINLHRENLPSEVAASLDDCSKAASMIEQYLGKVSLLYTNPGKGSCSLNEIVSIAADILEVSARRKNIRINRDFQEKIPVLYADGSRLLQIITDFILDAIESESTVENLFLRTSFSGQHASLQIKGDRDDHAMNDSPFYSMDTIKEILGEDSGILSDFSLNSGLIISFYTNKPEEHLIEIQDSNS